MTSPRYRWSATITYRSEKGDVDVEHELFELHELHHLVELGPHWDTIVRIEVLRFAHITSETLTVEAAEKM